MRRNIGKTIKPKAISLNELSEEQLAQRLLLLLVGIASSIIVITVSLIFFAPKIGGFFGFISRHYNEEEKPADITPASPV